MLKLILTVGKFIDVPAADNIDASGVADAAGINGTLLLSSLLLPPILSSENRLPSENGGSVDCVALVALCYYTIPNTINFFVFNFMCHHYIPWSL